MIRRVAAQLALIVTLDGAQSQLINQVRDKILQMIFAQPIAKTGGRWKSCSGK
jgi:hypothetical protein